MSRSKHTDPRRVRAARRLRAPYEPRGHGDPSRPRALARALKARGFVPAASPRRPRDTHAVPLPTVRVQRPRPGFTHPASRADVGAVLRYFGAACLYGVRAVELRQGPLGPAGRRHPLGRLRVPGTVMLFDQPVPPWRLLGQLSAAERTRLEDAGAVVEELKDGRITVVAWPDPTLRDFMLFEVLMHEIGHHLIQQYTGKRTTRVARTRDHEAAAQRFAQRCRRLFRGERAE